MTLWQEGAASRFFLEKLLSYEEDGVEVLKCFFSARQNQIIGRSKVVHVAVVVLLVESKPPAAVGEYISKGERHDLGAAAPFSTMTSPLQGRAGGSTFSPIVVEPFGPSWILFAEKVSLCIA